MSIYFPILSQEQKWCLGCFDVLDVIYGQFQICMNIHRLVFIVANECEEYCDGTVTDGR